MVEETKKGRRDLERPACWKRHTRKYPYTPLSQLCTEIMVLSSCIFFLAGSATTGIITGDVAKLESTGGQLA